jgi:hypothetical protein
VTAIQFQRALPGGSTDKPTLRIFVKSTCRWYRYSRRGSSYNIRKKLLSPQSLKLIEIIQFRIPASTPREIPFQAYVAQEHDSAFSLRLTWLRWNEYNNPSFATMFQRALLNTCITTCFGLNPSHHQVLWYSCLIKHAETLLRTKDCCTHFIVTCATGCTHPI